jgi:hypothetical protein
MAIYNYYQLPLAEYLRQFHLNGRQKEIELSANLVMKINHHWLLLALINKILKKCLFLLCLVGWDIKSARQARPNVHPDLTAPLPVKTEKSPLCFMHVYVQ